MTGRGAGTAAAPPLLLSALLLLLPLLPLLAASRAQAPGDGARGSVSVSVSSSSENANVSAVCAGVITFPVGGTPQQLENAAQTAEDAVEALPLYLEADCQNAMLVDICLQTYAPLNREPDGDTAVCASVCEVAQQDCDSAVVHGYFPSTDEGYLYNCSDANVTQCLNYTNAVNESALNAEEVCPGRLVVPDKGSDPTKPFHGTACALPCKPSPITVTHDEWDSIEWSMYITGTLAFVASVYMVCMSAVHLNYHDMHEEKDPGSFAPTKRTMYWNIFWFSVGFLVETSACLMSIVRSPTDMLCENNAEETQHTSRCWTQGLLISTSILWTGGWSLVMLLDLLAAMDIVSSLTARIVRRRSFGLCLILPVICLIGITTTGQVGSNYNGTVPFCFLYILESPRWATYAFFFWPLTGIIFFGFLGIAVAIHRCSQIIYQARSSRKTMLLQQQDMLGNGNGRATVNDLNAPLDPSTAREPSMVERPTVTADSFSAFWDAIKLNRRAIMLFVLHFASFMVFCAERFQTELKTHDYKGSLTDLASCYFRHPDNAISHCGKTPSDRLPPAESITIVIFVCGFGLIPWLTFGVEGLVGTHPGLRQALIDRMRNLKVRHNWFWTCDDVVDNDDDLEDDEDEFASAADGRPSSYEASLARDLAIKRKKHQKEGEFHLFGTSAVAHSQLERTFSDEDAEYI